MTSNLCDLGKIILIRRDSSSEQARTIPRKIRLTYSAPVSLLVSLGSILSGPQAVRAETLTPFGFTDLAHRCGPQVAPLTLAAVAKTESRFRTLAVSDNSTGRTRVYDDRAVAAAAAQRLIAAGHSVDLGLMQINSANLRRLGMTPRDALEPCRAIAAAATILSRNFAAAHRRGTEQAALRDALSMYNTGNARAGYRNGYVGRIEQAALSLGISPDGPVRGRAPGLAVRVAYAAPAATSRSAATWDVWSSSNQTGLDDEGTAPILAL